MLSEAAVLLKLHPSRAVLIRNQHISETQDKDPAVSYEDWDLNVELTPCRQCANIPASAPPGIEAALA
jgi:hypothetical protein